MSITRVVRESILASILAQWSHLTNMHKALGLIPTVTKRNGDVGVVIIHVKVGKFSVSTIFRQCHLL